MNTVDLEEYKQTWLSNPFRVTFSLKQDWKAKDWCRKNCERHQWSMNVDPQHYKHTVLFEHKHHALKFIEEFDCK